jgi:hypothetical protein
VEDSTQAPAIREEVRFIGTPEALGELYTALAAAQGEFLPVVKDSQANVQMKSGGNYKFEYAGLDVVIAATQPALSKHGIAFMQFPTSDALVTVLAKGGARIESHCSLPRDAQAFGSAITYSKRYARLSILSVFPADEDDDGAAATGHKATITRSAPPTPAAKPAAAAKATDLTHETKARIGALGREAGLNKEDLQAIATRENLGALEGLGEASGAKLVAALQAMKVRK